MITPEEFARRSAAAGDRLPLLSLAECFDGNDEEESIAPNQVGYGRPDLVEIRRRLAALEADGDVAWVRVQPHEEALESGQVVAESVAICTTAPSEDVAARIDAESLESDGVVEGLSYELGWFCDVPPVPDGHRLVSLVWD